MKSNMPKNIWTFTDSEGTEINLVKTDDGSVILTMNDGPGFRGYPRTLLDKKSLSELYRAIEKELKAPDTLPHKTICGAELQDMAGIKGDHTHICGSSPSNCTKQSTDPNIIPVLHHSCWLCEVQWIELDKKQSRYICGESMFTPEGHIITHDCEICRRENTSDNSSNPAG